MANLAEVRTALKQGDRQKASQLLKAVLQQRPTADAWYMAAQMASSKETAMKHLNRALTLDSRHVKARDMLRELGGEQKAATHHLVGEIRTEIANFGENNRFLSRFSPKQRAIIAASAFGLVALTLVALLMNLARPREAAPTLEFIPAPTTVVLASDTLRNHFTGSGLIITEIDAVEPPPETPVTEQVVMAVQDTVTTHEVTVYLYPSLDGLVNDRLRLAGLGTDNKIVVYQTAVLVYPATVESVVASSLENVFNTLPLTPPIQ